MELNVVEKLGDKLLLNNDMDADKCLSFLNLKIIFVNKYVQVGLIGHIDILKTRKYGM